MPDWLWQGLVTNSVYALLILAGGLMLAILQKEWPIYATPALYGVIGGSVPCNHLFCIHRTRRFFYAATQNDTRECRGKC